MVPDKILLRYGEIFLKGKNRNLFENKLVGNIKKLTDLKKVEKLRSRFVVDYFENHTLLRRVFGLTSYSPAHFVEKDLEKIKKKVVEVLKSKKGTFKVETKRSDKSFPIKSPKVNSLVGECVEKNSNLTFSFENPDRVIKIEINQKGTYIFFDVVKCFGGLPTGVEGKVSLLVENEASILAGLLFMKRGCKVVPVGKKDISLLQRFSPDKLELKKDLSGILVTGENYDNLKEHKEMVLRPLIAYSDERIKKELKMFKV